jgi:diguanylate cyclase (GGDEF)-like protein
LKVLRIAVFSEGVLRRRLQGCAGPGLEFHFHSHSALRSRRPKLDDVDGALAELAPRSGQGALTALRQALGVKPIASISSSSDSRLMQRSARLGFDFHVTCWTRGQPPAAELRARFEVAGSKGAPREMRPGLRASAERLLILTDIIKTANSILEPRKVIELVMAKVQKLIPSEAWSILLVDEDGKQLSFEMALGTKGEKIDGMRLALGEGVAGWVAKMGKPAIVNDPSRDPRFSPRVDTETAFQTRSLMCAPLISRGRTIGVVQVVNRTAGKFTRGDLNILLTLVDPCAIAIENAFLFQKAEQLTITDDLTKLYNSRYLNHYMSRELKRCKRHSIPLSVVFLDLDGFKDVNDKHGHLAGSTTLNEVGGILREAVRESDVLARYGGDEFVVVLPETPIAGALVIAERIRQSIEEHDFLASHGVVARISASFGIACFPEHALTPEGLIQKADQAMYRVKERNKNGIEVSA